MTLEGFKTFQKILNEVVVFSYSSSACSWETIPLLWHLWDWLSEWSYTITVCYLPVYYPSTTECHNPALYAQNVRTFMHREYNKHVPLIHSHIITVTYLTFSYKEKLLKQNQNALSLPHFFLLITQLYNSQCDRFGLPPLELSNATIDTKRILHTAIRTYRLDWSQPELLINTLSSSSSYNLANLIQ
jgi:hypothetical protein